MKETSDIANQIVGQVMSTLLQRWDERLVSKGSRALSLTGQSCLPRGLWGTSVPIDWFRPGWNPCIVYLRYLGI